MITVEHLTKAFGPKLAVNDVTFTVNRGEVLGFLGPNGAGKSTTMRMVTGFIPPTSGTITVGGHDVLENPIPAKRMIGYLPENAPGYADMTVTGFLRFAAELRGLHGDARKRAVNRAIELCFLQNVVYQSIDTLSKGYKHRTCLAQSLIHDPPILIMDEPTDGLDPNQKHEVRNLIKRMGQDKAIIFSTHILEEVEAVCSRVIIIDRGRLIYDGDLRALVRRIRPERRLTMRLSEAVDPGRAKAFGTLVSQSEAQIVLSVPADRVSEVVRGALGTLPVTDLAVEDAPLEDVMRELFRDKAAHEAPGDGAVVTANDPSSAESLG